MLHNRLIIDAKASPVTVGLFFSALPKKAMPKVRDGRMNSTRHSNHKVGGMP